MARTRTDQRPNRNAAFPWVGPIMSTVRPSKTPDSVHPLGAPPGTHSAQNLPESRPASSVGPAEFPPALATPSSAAVQPQTGGSSVSTPSSVALRGDLDSTSAAQPSDLLGDKTVISVRPVGRSSSAGTKTTAMPIGLQGTRLAHFELLEFVGGGGMGAVYRGHDLKLDRPVAIKVLAREQASDSDLVRRFQNEARSAARLDHDNIARVYDFGEDSGWHYIVFEFVEGQNVRDLVQQSGPLAVADAMHYTQQLAMALHHAAERDVVHRDIKPSNVVLNQSDHVKLVDMGLARLHQIDAPGDDLTASGVTLGTFDYISPEQARDPRVADVRSDIYSLGCTLFFMLTGSPPFPHGTALQKLLSHTNDPAPDPRQFRGDIPDEVVGLMQRMMAKDPNQRYQDPREIIVEIGQMCQRFGWEERHHFPTLIVHSHQRAVGFWERQLTWMGPIAMVAAIAAGAEIYARYRQPVALAVPQFIVPGSPELLGPSTTSASGTANRSSDVREPADAGVPSGRETTADSQGRADERTGTGRPAGNSAESATANPTAIGATTNGSTSVAKTTPSPDTARSTAEDEPSDGAAGVEPAIATGDSGSERPRPVGNGESIGRGAGSQATATIVVDPNYEQRPTAATRQSRVVSSLDMALSIAGQDPAIERIELAYHGRLRASAATISGRDLQLVAAEGFDPVVVFQPDPDSMPVIETFLRLDNSRVRIQRIHFELDLPQDSFVPWSLLRVEPGCEVALANTTVTVRTAAPITGTPPDIAIVAAHPRTSVTNGSSESQPLDATKLRPVQLALSNCIVRGPVSLVRASEATSLTVDWENGLMAGDRLATIGGTAQSITGDAKIVLRLSHVTAMLQRGLCYLTNNQRFANLIPLDVQCDDTIFLTRNGSVLIEQRGTASSERFQRQVMFTGNRNFYEGFGALWKIASVSEPERTWNPAAWRTYWRSSENSSRFDAVEWLQPPPTQLPLELHTPNDYRLRESISNPAMRSAADFRNAGVDTGLPRLPAASGRTISAIQP